METILREIWKITKKTDLVNLNFRRDPCLKEDLKTTKQLRVKYFIKTGKSISEKCETINETEMEHITTTTGRLRRANG